MYVAYSAANGVPTTDDAFLRQRLWQGRRHTGKSLLRLQPLLRTLIAVDDCDVSMSREFCRAGGRAITTATAPQGGLQTRSSCP